jgi:hypothetical protein
MTSSTASVFELVLPGGQQGGTQQEVMQKILP